MTALAAKKDTSSSKAWLRALEMTARIENDPARTLPVVVEESLYSAMEDFKTDLTMDQGMHARTITVPVNLAEVNTSVSSVANGLRVRSITPADGGSLGMIAERLSSAGFVCERKRAPPPPKIGSAMLGCS